MQEALIGLFGVLLGVGVNELVRRRMRIEQYSAPIFEKRLEFYEELFRRLQRASEVGEHVLATRALSKDQRLALVSQVIQDIAGYCDDHEMYISDELAVHCTAVLMGVEEVPDLPDGAESIERVTRFRDGIVHAKRMIRKECGIARIDALFRSITKAKLSSPIIDYYRSALRARGKKGKWTEP